MGITRKTKSVKALLEVFEGCNAAMSTTALIEKFKHQMNRSTVYRILERLEDDGTLHSFIGKDGLKWYAPYTSEQQEELGLHPHFQCEDCGKTECLPISIQIPEVEAYNINTASILLTGKCKDCED
ncbi:Fur family transcriptional regulator [Seonamhaeicola marinus]|uniref:Transcriptional regulator n=1 Tax=Seonamhaeicola marinus TaxID=1912246 RepID=A0A5D0I6T4_9FLAO|nr:transcriptional repressor [Seonamhaeicola marinus]TYA78570.1 transcriptional regulator [Seonamhaeicola marinus]